MKNNKKLIIVLAIAVILIVVVGLVIYSVVSKSKTNKGEVNYTEYDYIKSAVEEYGDSNQKGALLEEHETDIVVFINELLKTSDGDNFTATINYTTMKTTCMFYDENNKPLSVATLTVDEGFNILSAYVFNYETGDINIYEDEDNLAKYEDVAKIILAKHNVIFKELLKKGITLFNKSLANVKESEYIK